MKRQIFYFVLAATCFTTIGTTALPAPQPKIGDVLPVEEGTFKGWTLARADQGGAGHQSYALFWKNGSYLIALTQILERGSPSGTRLQRIVKVEAARAAPNEKILDDIECSPDGSEVPIIAFYNAKSGTVRGIFARPGALATKRWSQDIEKCAVPDD